MTGRRTIVALAGVLLALVAVLGWRSHVQAGRIAMLRTDADTIPGRPDLRRIALTRGHQVYDAQCASCHSAAGKGDPAKAMPDLTDDDFLYGQGKPAEIEQIVLHGIRAGDTRGWDLAAMPAFAQPVPYTREKLPSLTPGQISDIVAFLRAANGSGSYERAQVDRGRVLFQTTAGCWDCHGSSGEGDPAIGAPNVVDGTWLKGDGGEADIRHTLERGLAGVSPAFAKRLSAYDARAVAVYVASLHPPIKASANG